MSKSKKSTKIIEPTTTSEMKESEMKSHSKMTSSSHKTKNKDASKTSTMMQSIHPKNSRDRDESQIKEIWGGNLQEAMTQIEDIIEKYPYIALVCYVLMLLSILALIDMMINRTRNSREL